MDIVHTRVLPANIENQENKKKRKPSLRRWAPAGVRSCPRGCLSRYSYGCVGVRRAGVCVCFSVETLYFLMFFPAHTCLLFTVSTTHNTTQFTFITAHHDPIAAVCLLFRIYLELLTAPGPGSRMDTDIDVVKPYVQPDKAPKSRNLRCKQARVTPLTSSSWATSTESRERWR